MARKKANSQDYDDIRAQFAQIAKTIIEVDTDVFLKENFLPYAWDYTLNRAITDKTGLKPVQKYILYTMYEDGLKPNAHRSKVSTLAGRTLAYHPHGDSSINDALKNMAREHEFRVPLIAVKGDSGTPGMPGAAGRYLEARLSEAGWLNVQDIDNHAVDMVDNYDSSRKVAQYIPVRFPVALVNGGSGISVGFASNMPSHNPTEIMNALIALIDSPTMREDRLESLISAPDFNMGGEIIGLDGVHDYMRTGQGSFIIRGRYNVTELKRGKYRIDFYNIPFGTSPMMIVEDISKGINNGHFSDIANYKNLSDFHHPIRVSIETKSGVNVKKLIAELFKYTNLQSAFNANMTTIVNGIPCRTGMRDLLNGFINFRKGVILQKTQYARDRKAERLHLVEGMITVNADIDKAIAIIRKADGIEVARGKLMKTFKIDESQANYVLSKQLRSLTRTDTLELNKERENLLAEISSLDDILSNEKTLKNYMKKEFRDTLKVIKSERITLINETSHDDVVAQESHEIEKIETVAHAPQPLIVTLWDNNTLTVSKDSPRLDTDRANLPYGGIAQTMHVMSDEDIFVLDSHGGMYTVPLSYFTSARHYSLDKLGVTIDSTAFVVGLAKRSVTEGAGLFVATRKGGVKIAKPDFAQRSPHYVSLQAGDEVAATRWIENTVSDSARIVLVSSESKILVFPATQVRHTGSKSSTMAGMSIPDGVRIIGADLITPDDSALVYSFTGHSAKATPLKDIPVKSRATAGVVLHDFSAKLKDKELRSATISQSPCLPYDGMNGMKLANIEATARAKKGVFIPALLIRFARVE